MKNRFISLNLDFLGFSASFLCAIHCALLPILLTFSAMAGLEFLEDPFIEYGMIGLSAVLASLSLIGSYKKSHRNPLPLYIVAFGFTSIMFSHLGDSEVFEAIFMTIGGFSIAGSHVYNWKLCKSCEACKVV